MPTIEIDGKSFPMRASIGAWKNFEETTGKTMADLQTESNADMQTICTLAFYFVVSGCKKNGVDFDFSIDEFMDEIEISDLESISLAVGETMQSRQKKRMTKRPPANL